MIAATSADINATPTPAATSVRIMNGSVISWTTRGRNPASTQARSPASCRPEPAAAGVVMKPSSARSARSTSGSRRQGVVDRQRDAQRLAGDQPRAHERRRVQRQRHERQVERAPLDLRDAVAGHHAAHQLERDLGVALPHRPGERGQREVVERAGEADAHRAVEDPRHRPRGLPGQLQLLEHPVRVRQQRLARGRERDAARAAVEERDAQLAFQPPDRLRQRRLGHPQPGRGPPEVQLFGDGEERLQPPDLHGPILAQLSDPCTQ